MKAKGYLWRGWVNLEPIEIDLTGWVFYGGYEEKIKRGEEIPKFKLHLRKKRKSKSKEETA